MMPFSSVDPGSASFLDCVFTATSAVCVTGLVVRDTATYWTSFGQFIILILIQIGGLGVITFTAAIALLSRKKIDFFARNTMQEAMSAPKVGGIVRLTSFIIKATALIEGTGFVLLLPIMCKEFGIAGIWYALFHSISAFCNAGFDLMGIRGHFSSLTAFYSNIPLNFTIMALIVLGGLGFLTYEDIQRNGFRFKKYSLQSKVIITTSAILVFVPALIFYLFEFKNLTFQDRILTSLFQSVTARTAGFNTFDFMKMSESGLGVMILLMIVGGSPGSTAGGMKTTTLAILFFSMSSTFKKSKDVEAFGRRIDDDTVYKATTLGFLYLVLFFVTGFIISAVEGLPLVYCLFETASAIGTVGLTVGITPTLGLFSRVILMMLMFFGRIGGLTLFFALNTKSGTPERRYPVENISVG